MYSQHGWLVDVKSVKELVYHNCREIYRHNLIFKPGSVLDSMQNDSAIFFCFFSFLCLVDVSIVLQFAVLDRLLCMIGIIYLWKTPFPVSSTRYRPVEIIS